MLRYQIFRWTRFAIVLSFFFFLFLLENIEYLICTDMICLTGKAQARMISGMGIDEASRWNHWDTLFTIVSSFIVSACGITNIFTGVGFINRGDPLWSMGYFMAVGLRMLLSFYFFRKEEYESSWWYRVCTVLQLNFLLDGLRCCGQRKYLANFYWGKLLHSTLEAIPLSFGTVYILLDGEVSSETTNRQLGAVALSVICISITASICNHAPLYQSKKRKWASFLLRFLELVTFDLSFGLFAHKFKAIAIPVMLAKYLGAAGLIFYHNRKTGTTRDVIIFSGFAALLDMAIIWYSSSLPPISTESNEVQEHRHEAFLVEDGTIKSCTQSLLLSDVYIVTTLALTISMSNIHGGFETSLLLIALISFCSQHIIYIILVLTHPQHKENSKSVYHTHSSPN